MPGIVLDLKVHAVIQCLASSARGLTCTWARRGGVRPPTREAKMSYGDEVCAGRTSIRPLWRRRATSSSIFPCKSSARCSWRGPKRGYPSGVRTAPRMAGSPLSVTEKNSYERPGTFARPARIDSEFTFHSPVWGARISVRQKEGPPCHGARREESNLGPRQQGAAGADHHRGITVECPCRALPYKEQPRQATAERAALRRPPNGA